MSPYFLLSILIGGVYGAVFYVWQGKSTKDLLYYLPAAIIGFGLGQVAANLLNRQFLLIGPLHIIEATVSCWLVLFLARWLKV